MNEVIGIDLGTTSSRVAILRGGKPVVLENAEGDGTTPSHVALTPTGLPLVGKPARRYALKDPANVIFAVKRIIGRRFDDPIVQQLRRFMPYEIAATPKGDACVAVQGISYAPEQITAIMLQKMRDTSESYLGHTVAEAVIAVPAYFSERQRQATKNAAELAGLNVLRLYAEPTVAAVAHGFGSSAEGLIAVYDLGGGTFDISILDIGDGVFEVKSTAGDLFLGGEDFDIRLVDHIAAEYRKESNIDLLADPLARQRLKEAAEAAKIALSSELTTDLDLPFIAAEGTTAKHLHMTLTRSTLEELIRDMIERSIKICEKAVKEAEVDKNRISRVVLVGGSTRIPLVQEQLRNFFGQEPYGGIRREDSVVLGTAIMGGVIRGQVRDNLLLDVVAQSIGIETLGGVFTSLIDRNTTIPTRHSEIFSTASDNQTVVKVKVLEGDGRLAKDNQLLSDFDFDGIPPAPRGSPQIEVTFDVDANGLLRVSAKDLATGREQKITVKQSAGFSADELRKLQEAAQRHFEQRVYAESDSMSQQRPREALSSAIASPTTEQRHSLQPHKGESKQSIFVSYAREDEQWARAVEKSLSMVARKTGARIWIDRMLATGDRWEATIYSQIEQATIAILLLSSDFLNSEFILKNELPRLLAERERRYLRLFPIMVRSCPYDLHDDLAQFQFFNDTSKPLASMEQWEVDEELTRLAHELANKVLQLTE